MRSIVYLSKTTKVLFGGGNITAHYKYQAFISYAHKDEAVATRLHRALETYRIPKNIEVAAEKTLSPIFRDAAELTAHHSLSEKIREAVQGSRVLIVICSPAAKTSHWVNEEIRLFRALHGEGSILCVLAVGTPETSFPLALIEEGREPLAANLGTSKESFRLGTTQLAASMLGVGLDVLIQRDSKRRRRRLQLITASALMFAGMMAATALTAIDARNDAQNSRSQAEGLVEYMITDLKDKLEPVGRLDILDSVGDEAVKYYDAQNTEELSDESLARQASARHILGQVALDSGDLAKANKEIETASFLTAGALKHNPNDTDALFAHAQSEYWLGQIKKKNKNYQGALLHWEQYSTIGQKLYEIDPSNFNWVMERAWGPNNVAYLYHELNDFDSAQKYYLESITYFEKALELIPNSAIARKELANTIAGVSLIFFKKKDYETAKVHKKREIILLQDLIKSYSQDINLQYRHHRARIRLYEIDALLDSASCDKNKSSMFMDEFQTFLNHDKVNYKWQHEHVKYWYNTLNACSTIYSKDDLNKQIEKLLSHIEKTLNKEDQERERAKVILLKL